MKNLVILFLVVFPIAMQAQQNPTIGMSIDEVKRMYSGLGEERYEKTITLTNPDTLYGLADEWGYRFENQKLDWIFFHCYEDSLSETNFNQCLAATMHLIGDYTQEFGSPDTLIVGTLKFRNPYTDHHWGYDVIEAKWFDADGMKIKIEFTFFGGKGEYNFIVNINQFGKEYPYFE